ncbi:hypothetical protein RFI_28840 [Reticulomyxa filosa]|uniref:OCRE domain-containing protein n=1 Tax=Reticulomyxa filosa TaxID=46433 RepID=X6M3J4_RETFI|nr:hypothetical protein RFI_28840 [Reticulomyxa filosa]|eukprot:ETO08543.1 hypothetical protein RFI_28840 [Reticulomyxa filosa]
MAANTIDLLSQVTMKTPHNPPHKMTVKGLETASIGNMPSPSEYGIAPTFRWDCNSGHFYDPNSGYYFDVVRKLYYFQAAIITSTESRTQGFVLTKECVLYGMEKNVLPFFVVVGCFLVFWANDDNKKIKIEPNSKSSSSLSVEDKNDDEKRSKTDKEKGKKKTGALRFSLLGNKPNINVNNSSNDQSSLLPSNSDETSVSQATNANLNSMNTSSPIDLAAIVHPSLLEQANSFLDYNRHCCMLCRRNLKNTEKLHQHAIYSQLHKNNLIQWNLQQMNQQQMAQTNAIHASTSTNGSATATARTWQPNMPIEMAAPIVTQAHQNTAQKNERSNGNGSLNPMSESDSYVVVFLFMHFFFQLFANFWNIESYLVCLLWSYL